MISQEAKMNGITADEACADAISKVQVPCFNFSDSDAGSHQKNLRVSVVNRLSRGKL